MNFMRTLSNENPKQSWSRVQLIWTFANSQCIDQKHSSNHSLLLLCVHHADNGQSRKQSDWAGMDVEAPPDRSYSVNADCVTHLRMKSVGWTVRTSKCRLFRREFLIPFRLEGYSRASLTSTCKWTNTNVGKIGSWLCLWQWTILLTIMIEWCGDF